MSKIKSKDDLLDAIDKEYTWRFREIDLLKGLLQRKSGNSKYEEPLAKALVALAYSHWEGFVKYSSDYFFDYIRFKGFKKSELSEEFIASCIQHLSDNKKCADATSDIIQCLKDANYRFSFDNTILTSAESNLKFEVLRKIASNLAVNMASMNSIQLSLDTIVLKRRNDVAHGDKVHVTDVYGIEVADHVISFMQQFKTLLQNHIASEGYLN